MNEPLSFPGGSPHGKWFWPVTDGRNETGPIEARSAETRRVLAGMEEKSQPAPGSGPVAGLLRGEIILYKFPVVGVYPVNLQMPSDPNWQRDLYEAQAAGLVLYGRALGLSHAEAEDVVQEIFVALLQLGSAPEDAPHYCLRAFRNTALNYRRSLWRRLTRELESRRWFEKARGESPQERAAMRCLAGLPAEQREVIVLKIWHGHTFETIGGLLDISPHTAAGRYRYGLEKLRVCLNEIDYEEQFIGNAARLLEAAPPVGET